MSRRHEDFPGVFETDGDRYDAWCDRHPVAEPRVTPYNAAFVRVLRGERFEDIATLALTERGGHSIAHVQAMLGWTTTDPAVLALAAASGFTVAASIAAHDPEHCARWLARTAARRVTP